MSQEPTTPHPVELLRRAVDALSRGDLDSALRLYAPNCVWEMETGTPEGAAAIRSFLEDWTGPYEEFEMELEQNLDLGNGVGFAVIRQRGRLIGSSGEVQMRLAFVGDYADGLLVWGRSYTETQINEARADAERLAEQRG